MGKVLLREYYALCEGGVCQDLLTEAEKRDITENNAMYLTGLMQQADVQNGNGRVYPLKTLMREMKTYQKLVKEKRALGELDHPDDSVINLKNASHMVTNIWADGPKVMGTVKVLETPSGQILKSLVESGVQLGISSRGLGSVRESMNGGVVVEDDFQLICFDFVSEPSTPNAFMNLQEGKQYKEPNIEGDFISEEADDAEKETSGGSWPSKPPKTIRITSDSNLSDEQILGVWKKLSSMNPPKDPDEILRGIGGPEALVSHVKQLEKNFAKAGNAPPRSKMPVVDPKKDIEDLRGRLAKGKLDVKPPFADWDELEGEATTQAGKQGVARDGRQGPLAVDPNSKAKKTKRSLASRGRMREGEEEFPTDLVDDPDPVQDAYLTKGLHDGDRTDDSAVQLVDDVKIGVSSSFPTQSEVYLDKSMWNIMNFGPTKKGGTAFGKPNLIAIQDG